MRLEKLKNIKHKTSRQNADKDINKPLTCYLVLVMVSLMPTICHLAFLQALSGIFVNGTVILFPTALVLIDLLTPSVQ